MGGAQVKHNSTGFCPGIIMIAQETKKSSFLGGGKTNKSNLWGFRGAERIKALLGVADILLAGKNVSTLSGSPGGTNSTKGDRQS